jgi:L-ribulokinase
MMEERFVIGVDFGTDSVRAIVVDSGNGEMFGEDQREYPRWMDGKYCIPEQNLTPVR